MLSNYWSKFSLKHFGQYLKKWKNWFPIGFSKSNLTLVGFIFGKKNLKKPKTQKYGQVLVVTCWKLKSEKCLLWSFYISSSWLLQHLTDSFQSHDGLIQNPQHMNIKKTHERLIWNPQADWRLLWDFFQTWDVKKKKS